MLVAGKPWAVPNSNSIRVAADAVLADSVATTTVETTTAVRGMERHNWNI
jgi:hypothetical protein